MTDLEQIADTIATEFTQAVRAANKARAQQTDNVMTSITDAINERNEALGEVRRLQEEAAKLAAESIRLAEKTEAQFTDRMRAAMQDMNELRGTVPLTGRGKVRAIAGGKAAE